MSLKDIQRLDKPKAAQPTIKRIRQYIETMVSLNKPVAHVALAAKDYDLIFKSMQARRQDHEPKITGLRFGDIRVDRGGA